MNFTKHQVTEYKMLSEMMDYCKKILDHKQEQDTHFAQFSTCISTRTNGVEVNYYDKEMGEKFILAIRYDERNDHYYFLENRTIGKMTLENRIIIHNKAVFTAYFEEALANALTK